MKRGKPSVPKGGRIAAPRQAALSPKAQQLFDRGQERTDAGDFEGSAAAFSSVTAMRPDVYQAQFNLGRALAMLGRDDEAVAPLQRVLTLHPRHVKAATLLAKVSKRLGNLEDSVRLFDRALKLDPLDPTLVVQLAETLSLAGRDREAREVYRNALAITPDSASIHYNLGNLVRKLEGDAAATPSYARAVELDPGHVRAWASLGITHARDSPEKAIEYFRQAIDRAPGYLSALYGLLSIEQRYCDFDASENTYARILEALKGKAYRILNWQKAANLVYKSLLAELPWPAIHALQQHIAQILESEVRAQGPLPQISAPSHTGQRRLRIGYLSPNFGNHPVGHVTLSLFPAHDRGRFEVHALSTNKGGSDGSDAAIRHRTGVDAFHEIGGMRAKNAAAHIRSIGIDILIDLDGYMENTSPPILAFRAAPVQVFWLGHGAGLGLPFVDYLIADAVVLPPGEERNYGEAIVRLPDVYHCTDRPLIADGCPPRRDWGLPEEATVYCVFNNPDKIDRQAFDCWMRILKGVDGSVLWFSPFRQQRNRLLANLHRYAAQHGVDPTRLILSDRVPDKSMHLARIGHADLMLDTFTLNASSTALDGLWAGVPLLALRGNRFSNRISNSMLHALGLDDLVCADLEEYERRAIELGRDPAARSELRRRLRANRDTTPLFDVERFTRTLERGYATMWERHRNGQPATGFDVPPVAKETE